MVTVAEGVVIALLGGGLFFAAVAAVGLVRLPDLYTRAHSASKSDTLGVVLTLAAAAIAFDTDTETLKLALLIAFMFVTNPTAAHAIVRAAADQGIDPWTADDADDGSVEVDAVPPDSEAGDDPDGAVADGGGRS